MVSSIEWQWGFVFFLVVPLMLLLNLWMELSGIWDRIERKIRIKDRNE